MLPVIFETTTASVFKIGPLEFVGFKTHDTTPWSRTDVPPNPVSCRLHLRRGNPSRCAQSLVMNPLWAPLSINTRTGWYVPKPSATCIIAVPKRTVDRDEHVNVEWPAISLSLLFKILLFCEVHKLMFVSMCNVWWCIFLHTEHASFEGQSLTECPSRKQFLHKFNLLIPFNLSVGVKFKNS